MEEYLQYMKTLRSQMNDVEDQTAKISVQEQMQLTSVRTLENDIAAAKSEITQLKEYTEQMKKAKGEVCSKILEKQKKIASLESDTFILTQTLELIQQERVGLSSKLSEKRAYYHKIAEDMSDKLQKQQVKEKVNRQRNETQGNASIDGNFLMYSAGTDGRNNLNTKLDSATKRLDEILLLKSKMKLAVEDVRCRVNDFKPELKAADIIALQEEFNALLSDKAGETEYLQSLEKQVEKLKEIYHAVKCDCGEEYTVSMNV